MCTLTLAWRAFPDAPVVVAANRDEATDRPSTPPVIRDVERAGDGTSTDPTVTSRTRVLAPRDERAGGTWIGVNDDRVFAGITNRWTDSELDGERSRGLLVGNALTAPTAADAASIVRESVERATYDGFNLVIADTNDAILFEWDGTLSERHLDPGVHVVVNVGADDTFEIPAIRPDVGEQQAINARRARAELAVQDSESVDSWLLRARRILADHDYGLCIHGDTYGTRSSSLVVIRTSGDVEYDFAAGPPCETSFETIDHDL